MPAISLAVLGTLLTSCKEGGKASVKTGDKSTGGEAPAAPHVVPVSAPAAPHVVPVSLPKEITFNEHIQPILSEYCYHCHGPDSGTRKPKDAPLRLDREADAFAKRENGQPVIIKGDPAASLLVKLIKSHDPKEVMPPPEGHKELKPQDIALLEEWIRQGAKYEPHWAFAAIKHPEPPAAGEGFATNPIDRFIAQKLEENGLKPNSPEDPRRFYRRLAFDLTGLPPSTADTDAFVKRSAEDPKKAVEEAADKLLATPSSAEHFTRQWLDAARYADTHGIHIDNYRAIWPYRDWVIGAFQANMPWDQFTIEQIAGDLLPTPTLDQQVATGFNRCLATTGEGGAIGEEYNAIYAKDRTETTSAVWLGLTTGCAACHDHKFDPVSTKEFYSMTAFFRNSTMSALDGNNAEHPPNVFVPLMSDRARWGELATAITDTNKQIAEREKTAQPDFQKWVSNPVITESKAIDSTLVLHLPLNENEGGIKGIVDGQAREWPDQPNRIDGPLGKAPVVSDKPIEIGDLASFSRGDRVTYGGFVRIEGTPTGAVVARMNPAQSFRGWDIYLQSGKPATHVIDTWDKAANKLTANDPLSPGVWHHVMMTYDGTRPGHQTCAIYVDGKKQNGSLSPSSVGGTIETPVPFRLGSRANNDSKLNGPVALQDFRFYRRLLAPEEIKDIADNSMLRSLAAIPAGQRTKVQNDQLFRHFISNVDVRSRELRTSLDALKTEQTTLRARGSVSLVMDEKKDSAPFAHVLARGVYSDKGEKVAPDVPAALPPLPANAPRNRLGLAQWLVDPANPLPARVTMNRAWYYFFGTGIVETTEDFGIMGARPSHPQLLDWLATEFITSKWDYRHMVKLFVTSATYRQSGNVTPEKLEKDPLNRLLSRGPRVRLDAEQLRDMALASSDLLVDKVGGPSVKPYQPEGIWEAVAMKESNTKNYKQDSGEALYRRSLYTFWKRSAAPPSMELFNAPSREVFCVRRERTNTPLQALVMLNDPQFVEAAKMLAAHALEKGSTFDARLDFITSRLIDRPLKAEERKVVKTTFDRLFANYTSKPDEAKQLLATGATAAPAQLPAPELAAWTVVSSQLMNLDETVTR
ncbi:DUF1553 domain-containing protein [Luteolibacter ambystomatis]|uniref:DUF1553 domain-containing protein n=1 Tax=Luteolibacter ambystomatis TaxID=2824561 RepID=A0A975J2C4_9BACT|nr:DUF1553 domain-containing protein [Luteolibacter ambystomatis]QUE52699.1 DUF1553 domain-containing protein [Luteolibacter ambystomatis]